jgi:hypothetical protein
MVGRMVALAVLGMAGVFLAGCAGGLGQAGLFAVVWLVAVLQFRSMRPFVQKGFLVHAVAQVFLQSGLAWSEVVKSMRARDPGADEAWVDLCILAMLGGPAMVLLSTSCAMVARGKGRTLAWALAGLTSIVGFLVVCALPDAAPAAEPLRSQRPPAG